MDLFLLSSVFFCMISDIFDNNIRFSRSMVANRSVHPTTKGIVRPQ